MLTFFDSCKTQLPAIAAHAESAPLCAGRVGTVGIAPHRAVPQASGNSRSLDSVAGLYASSQSVLGVVCQEDLDGSAIAYGN